MCFQTFYYGKLRGSNIIFTSIFFDITRANVFLCKFFSIPYSIVFHGLDVLTWESNRGFINGLVEGADFLLFNSESTYKSFCNTYGWEKKYIIIHPFLLGREIDRISTLSKENVEENLQIKGLTKNNRVIVSICRLVERKGIEHAILAFQELVKDQRFSDCHYIIVGEGPELEKLIKLVKPEFFGNISFVGSISEEMKFSLLRHSNIFLMPNLTLGDKNVEGFGISFIEAAYLMNVVIGGRSGGVVEAINDKVNGFLIDEGDQESRVNQITTFLKSILKNKERSIRMAEEGKAMVINNFEFQVMLKKVADEF